MSNKYLLLPLSILLMTLLFSGCLKPKNESATENMESEELTQDLEEQDANQGAFEEEEEDETELFFSAIAGGDRSRVEQMLANGFSVETKDKNFRTPLQQAIESGQYEIAVMLVKDYGADINSTPNHLMKAIEKSDEEMFYFLLGNGADPNLAKNLGQTPMNQAARSGIDAFRSLEGYGGNIMGSGKGHIPLYDAVDAKKYSVIEYILSQDIEIDDAEFEEIYFLANQGGDMQATLLLEQYQLKKDGIVFPQEIIDRFEDPQIYYNAERKLSFLHPSSWFYPTTDFWEADMGEKATLNVEFSHPDSDFRNVYIIKLDEYKTGDGYEGKAQELLNIYKAQSLNGLNDANALLGLAGWGHKAHSDFTYVENYNRTFRGAMCYTYTAGHYASPDLTCLVFLTNGIDTVAVFRFSEKTSDMDFQNKLTGSTATEAELSAFVSALGNGSAEAIENLYENELKYVVESFARQ